MTSSTSSVISMSDEQENVRDPRCESCTRVCPHNGLTMAKWRANEIRSGKWQLHRCNNGKGKVRLDSGVFSITDPLLLLKMAKGEYRETA